MTKKWVVSGDLHSCFIALNFFRKLGYTFNLSRNAGKWSLYILLP